jgi:hypothetical protein
VGGPAGAVDVLWGWDVSDGGAAGTPTLVEDEVRGRRVAGGEGVRPVGPAEAEREDDESANGGSAGVLPLPPVKAMVTPMTTATTTEPTVTISNTPRLNRISSSRAWTDARSVEGRPCRPGRPAARTALLAGGAPA